MKSKFTDLGTLELVIWHLWHTSRWCVVTLYLKSSGLEMLRSKNSSEEVVTVEIFLVSFQRGSRGGLLKAWLWSQAAKVCLSPPLISSENWSKIYPLFASVSSSVKLESNLFWLLGKKPENRWVRAHISLEEEAESAKYNSLCEARVGDGTYIILQ